jgi:hypothetical protein
VPTRHALPPRLTNSFSLPHPKHHPHPTSHFLPVYDQYVECRFRTQHDDDDEDGEDSHEHDDEETEDENDDLVRGGYGDDDDDDDYYYAPPPSSRVSITVQLSLLKTDKFLQRKPQGSNPASSDNETTSTEPQKKSSRRTAVDQLTDELDEMQSTAAMTKSEDFTRHQANKHFPRRSSS